MAFGFDGRVSSEDVAIIMEETNIDFFKDQLKAEITRDSFNIHNVIEILKNLFKHASSKNISISSGFDFSIINSDGKALGNIEN